MRKDFDIWNEEKKRIHESSEYLPFYNEREVRWCRLGTNVGSEQDGTGAGHSRPVLILKGFSRRVCLIVPLTTSKKSNPYHIDLGEIDGRRAAVVISQLRLVDTRRLGKLLTVLDAMIFNDIRKAVKDML